MGRYEKILRENWMRKDPTLVQILKPKMTHEHFSPRCSLAADKKHIVLGQVDGELVVWDRITGRQVNNIVFQQENREEPQKNKSTEKKLIRPAAPLSRTTPARTSQRRTSASPSTAIEKQVKIFLFF